MEKKEVDIVLVDECTGKTYLISVKEGCTYKELKEKIEERLSIENDYKIFYINKIFEKDDEILDLKSYDILLLVNINQSKKLSSKEFEELYKKKLAEYKNEDSKTEEISIYNRKDSAESTGKKGMFMENENYIKEKEININFFLNEDENVKGFNPSAKINYLSGFLNLCLLKYITRKINDKIIKKIDSSELKEIIETMKKEIKFTGNLLEDFKEILHTKSGSNILVYSNYVNECLDEKKLKDLIELFEKKEKIEILKFWYKLSFYEETNKLFEQDFKSALKESFFDYSVISISIYQRSGVENFRNIQKQCPNCQKRILFHGTQIDPISKIITKQFLYAKKPFYGMGIYFSDMLDYIEFYAGGGSFDDRREFFGKTLSINKTFSCIAAETYYDKSKFKNIYDWSYFIEALPHFPTYEELKSKYSTKMVEKNGIHFAKVELKHGQVIGKDEYDKKIKETILGNEYVITEMDQIFPIYGLTLKRKEYFVIWRDPHFEGQNEHTLILKEAKMYINQVADMNVYFETSTESALKLIERKKFNKIILISSIGLDLSGKKFIELARKILGFNVFVLFFSANRKHLDWLQLFPNALYTNNINFYKKYITNYNKNGLRILKNEVENLYNVKFPEFTKDFLKFPKFIDFESYEKFSKLEKCDCLRHVFIFNKETNSYMYMNADKKVTLKKNKEGCLWDITIDNDKKEITLFSNNFYLSLNDETESVEGFEYMKIWNFTVSNNKYILKNKKENKGIFLSIIKESNYVIKATNNSGTKLDFIDK